MLLKFMCYTKWPTDPVQSLSKTSEEQTESSDKTFQLAKTTKGKRSKAGKLLSDFKQNPC